MQIGKLLSSIGVVLLFSCAKTENVVMDMSTFEKVYIELEILQGDFSYSSSRYATDEEFKHAFDSMRAELFKFYNTDSVQLNKAIQYYSQRPELMDTILAHLQLELESLQTKVNKNLENPLSN